AAPEAVGARHLRRFKQTVCRNIRWLSGEAFAGGREPTIAPHEVVGPLRVPRADGPAPGPGVSRPRRAPWRRPAGAPGPRVPVRRLGASGTPRVARPHRLSEPPVGHRLQRPPLRAAHLW